MEDKSISAEELIEQIAKQRKHNFEAGYDVVDWTKWSRLFEINPNEKRDLLGLNDELE